MKQRLIVLTAVLAVTAAACGGTPTTEGMDELGGEYTSDVLDTAYDGALSAANQLALGTLLLEDTASAVDAGQAAELLPLWQALQGGVTLEAEAEAVLRQIEAAMTTEQLEAIASMQLTQEDMQTWMADQGYGIHVGGPGGEPLSPEIAATLEAEGDGFRFRWDGEFQFPEDGEIPPEMATRMAEMQDMTEEERQAMRATAQAGGGFIVGPGGSGGPGAFGGRASGRTVGLLVRPLVQLLEARAAEG